MQKQCHFFFFYCSRYKPWAWGVVVLERSWISGHSEYSQWSASWQTTAWDQRERVCACVRVKRDTCWTPCPYKTRRDRDWFLGVWSWTDTTLIHHRWSKSDTWQTSFLADSDHWVSNLPLYCLRTVNYHHTSVYLLLHSYKCQACAVLPNITILKMHIRCQWQNKLST